MPHGRSASSSCRSARTHWKRTSSQCRSTTLPFSHKPTHIAIRRMAKRAENLGVFYPPPELGRYRLWRAVSGFFARRVSGQGHKHGVRATRTFWNGSSSRSDRPRRVAPIACNRCRASDKRFLHHYGKTSCAFGTPIASNRGHLRFSTGLAIATAMQESASPSRQGEGSENHPQMALVQKPPTRCRRRYDHFKTTAGGSSHGAASAPYC